MRRVFVSFVASALLASAVVYAEPSVYSSSSSRSSGRSLSGKNRNEIAVLKQRVRALNERVDGLTTVIEGLNATINELSHSQGNTATPAGGVSNDTEKRLREIEARMDSFEAGGTSRNKSKSALEATKSKADIKQKSTLPKPKETAEKKKKKKSTSQSSLSGKSASTLYSEGVRLFLKHKYSEAQKRFFITESKGYKPAASNYYLGEISYYTKKYDDAIFYFKKSAGLYDQASYIDTLLLHTAISLEKVGDKSQAKLFYETIIENYPDKKSAKIAKKNLKNL